MRFTSNYIMLETSNGSLNIPCKIANSISSSSNGLTCMACSDCNGDIGMSYYCKSCDKKDIARNETKKAIKIDKENKIPLTDELNEQINSKDKLIEVLGSITSDEIDKRRILGSFYVIPNDKTPSKIQKLFTRLQVGLLNSNTNFIVRFNNSSKQKLGILKAHGNILLILNYAFNSDFSEHEQDVKVDLTKEELDKAVNFVKKIKPIDINSIVDNRRELIEHIIENGDAVTVEPIEKEDETDPFDSDPVEVIAEKLKEESKTDKQKPKTKRSKKA